MARTLGVSQILSKNYKLLEIDPEWIDIVGTLPDPFSMIVIGMPKNGKTSFCMRFAKMLSKRYKTFYSSLEEGDSKTIQDAIIRAKMDEVNGDFFLGDGYFYKELKEKLSKKRSPKIVFIDSLDYMKLTTDQWKSLIRLYPRKSWVIICWGKYSAAEFAIPDNHYARQIKYQVGSVARVQNGIVETRGRYGMTDPLKLWDKKKQSGEQLKLVE